MEYIASGMNVEFVFIEGGYGEDATAALEAAVVNGDIDGIILAQAASPALMNAANGVPLIVVLAGIPASEAELQEIVAFDNYLGAVTDSDYDSAYAAAQALYDAGSRKVCLAGLTQGMSKSHDDRAGAFIDFVNAHDDMTLLAEDYSRGLFADAIGPFAASFPEMDGIFVTSGNDAILNNIKTEGLVGSVKLATIDISSESGTYYENGTLVYTAGGQYGTAMVGFSLLYNYLADGTRIISDTSTPLYRNYIGVNSSADFDNYIKYVDSGIPVYVVSEIKDLVHYYNAAVTYDTFVKLGEAYNLDDISTRHATINN
jgi:ABC-type sugar transport system substrate-binding protein